MAQDVQHALIGKLLVQTFQQVLAAVVSVDAPEGLPLFGLGRFDETQHAIRLEGISLVIRVVISNITAQCQQIRFNGGFKTVFGMGFSGWHGVSFRVNSKRISGDKLPLIAYIFIRIHPVSSGFIRFHPISSDLM